MPPAIIAGGIAAVGAIGGAVIGSHAQRSAANQANEAQQEATQAQLQLGRESMALNRDIYNSNYGTLSPFVARGNVAGDSINALLGLPSAPAMASPLGGQPGSQSGVPQANPGPGGGNGLPTPTNPLMAAGQMAAVNHGFVPAGGATNTRFLGGEPQTLPSIGPNALGSNDVAGAGGRRGPYGGSPYLPPTTGSGPGTPATPGTPTPTTPATTPQSAQSAFDRFANSAGMQFQLKQGTNALNNMYAAHGLLQSGAAMKGISDYAQNTALNNYFMPYMGLLGGQQAVGAGAASSIAGVGANFGNTAAAINAGMGANIQSGANSASNAAIARGNANAQMWSGIGSALGGFGSSFFPAH